ncbi:phosphatase PAP2 family protein [Kribbella sp. NPDC026611]|uniref:phosphatase PAP2 family protein n=1 Tax=Kribbella sp. NPDC026611 TaxID=3154911 RepID=UPI0033FA6C07
MTSTNAADPARPRRRSLAASAAVVLVGTAGLFGLADAATESDGLAAFDPGLTTRAVAHRTPALTVVAHGLTFLGNTATLVTLSLIAAAVLFRWSRRAAVVLVIAMIGSSAITSGLKALIGRARPDAAVVLGPLTQTFAFPSGHTLNATVFFGTIAALTWPMIRVGWLRVAVLAGAVVLSIGVGLSRVYLGYHWATDVLAGWITALVWLTVVLNVAQYGHPLRRRMSSQTR